MGHQRRSRTVSPPPTGVCSDRQPPSTAAHTSRSTQRPSAYMRKCMVDVTVKVHMLLKAQNAACRGADEVGLRTARANLSLASERPRGSTPRPRESTPGWLPTTSMTAVTPGACRVGLNHHEPNPLQLFSVLNQPNDFFIGSCQNDYHAVAVTPIIMKCFAALREIHPPSCTGPLPVCKSVHPFDRWCLLHCFPHVLAHLKTKKPPLRILNS